MTDTVIIPFDESYIDYIVDIENLSFGDPWSRDAFLSSARAPFTSIYLATDANGILFGYLVLTVISPECEILNIAVSPEHRRRGIADMLIAFACDKAREEKCDTVMLEVRASNIPAISLYEKHGFYSVGTRKAYYKNPTEDAILMDKTLK